MTAAVRVSGVVVKFGSTAVLDGLELELAAGQVAALVGPSGIGKSTLLRVIAGLVVPEAGRVEIDSIDVTAWPPHRRGVGMVFQDDVLFPHLDVAGNIGFGLRMHHEPRRAIAARVAELLDLVGLPGFEHRRVTTLSGGEAQRVSVARALAPRPSVLLLDEPFGALDRELHDRLVAEVAAVLAHLGTTALHVTHDRAEAAIIATRTIQLTAGRTSEVSS